MAKAFWVAVAALALLPAASASTVEFSFSENFGQAHMDARGQLAGSEADMARGGMDRDRDGTVTEDEATRFLESAKGLIALGVARMLTGDNFTLDGEPPTTTNLGDLFLEGAAGRTRGGPPIDFHLTMTFLFAAESSSTHTLRVTGHPTPGGAMEVTLRLPSGWTATGISGVEAEGQGTSEVTFVMPTRGQAVEFVFQGTKASPGPGAAAGLATLAAAALAVAARRTWSA